MPTKDTATKRLVSPPANLRICFDRVPEEQPKRLDRAAIMMAKKWPVDRRVINCRFLDGDNIQRKKVEEKAHIWEQHANVQFKFGARIDADIRISFSLPGSWSALGTDALLHWYYPKYQPTMNFGWLKSSTPDKIYEQVVLHEFGHALGLIHEHQNPNAKPNWNVFAVYRFFSGYPNYWSKQQIDQNIFRRYSPRGIDSTNYDPDSIMLYMFPGFLFMDGKGTKTNFTLSQHDKDFISKHYPF